MHKPIFFKNLSLSFAGKVCFENFNTQIMPRNRIAIIGNNGMGKSCLLKIIKGEIPPASGEVLNNKTAVFGYVPQLISDYPELSGGEKFNKALSIALSTQPDILLLDEPTNHLDLKNRKALIQMLNFYKGTLIVVSHDTELLNACVNTLWHIDNGEITIFQGKYDNYRQSILQTRKNIEAGLSALAKEKKQNHKSLMAQQQKAKKSKQRGEKLTRQKRWLPAVSDAKQSSAQITAGKNTQSINSTRQQLNKQLSALRIPEIVKPKFSIPAADTNLPTIIYISQAKAGYENKPILENINLSLNAGERLAIMGNNDSGKTTLFKAILNCPQVLKEGIWETPDTSDIGYLDQHYANLDDKKSVIETIVELIPYTPHTQVRDFLNSFLFKKNEEINKKISFLSGGERARLSLAVIAAKPPRLLLLDEITNNIDLETKEHVTQIIKEYNGAMLIISHDECFLNEIRVTDFYNII